MPWRLRLRMVDSRRRRRGSAGGEPPRRPARRRGAPGASSRKKTAPRGDLHRRRHRRAAAARAAAACLGRQLGCGGRRVSARDLGCCGWRSPAARGGTWPPCRGSAGASLRLRPAARPVARPAAHARRPRAAPAFRGAAPPPAPRSPGAPAARDSELPVGSSMCSTVHCRGAASSYAGSTASARQQRRAPVAPPWRSAPLVVVRLPKAACRSSPAPSTAASAPRAACGCSPGGATRAAFVAARLGCRGCRTYSVKSTSSSAGTRRSRDFDVLLVDARRRPGLRGRRRERRAHARAAKPRCCGLAPAERAPAGKTCANAAVTHVGAARHACAWWSRGELRTGHGDARAWLARALVRLAPPTPLKRSRARAPRRIEFWLTVPCLSASARSARRVRAHRCWRGPVERRACGAAAMPPT